MRLLTKLSGGTKAFVQPPFWSYTSPFYESVLGDKERIGNDFEGYVQSALKSSGVVFACIAARMLVFSEARFAWREITDGRTSKLFSDDALELLHRPWPNGTTGELLARMEQDASLAGNFYATIVGQQGSKDDPRRFRRLRPDWVTIVVASPDDDPNSLEARLLGYLYSPRGRHTLSPNDDVEVITPDEMVHFSPIPDPLAQFRGMSWLTPVIREIESDQAATKHKLNFFKRGATTNFVVKYDKELDPDGFKRFTKLFEEQYAGVENAYKVMHLGGGADATVVGANLRQLDFKATQGAGETRIAAAARVHPVILGLSEGLQGSSLNAGNFGAARRNFGDGTIRPLWRMAAASLEHLFTKPADAAQLWYDDRDVPFLREDAKDEGEILEREAKTIAHLVREGFDADSAVDAVMAGDLRKLKGKHTGRFSVQLQSADEGTGASS